MTSSKALWALLPLTALWAATPVFDPDAYLAHIKFLASPEMKGRGSGSPELEKAADYLARQYKADGLSPADGKSFLQPFPITASTNLGGKNHLEAVGPTGRQDFKLQQDFIPLNFSSRGKASGGAVFAGYGITAPEYNYDDYQSLDAKGKFVVVLRHEPQEQNEKSVFAGKNYTDHAQLYSKAANAKRHGAIGIILISDQSHHKDAPETLERFGTTEGPADAGISTVQVKSSVAEPWFRSANKSLSEIETEIDRDLKPRSFAFTSLELRENVDLRREVKTVHNVVAYLPGETSEYIIIGAHYDHLGLGGRDSLAPSMTGTVHPGADDNASGTAGVLELARYFASQPKQKRGFLFVSFAGEELGLLGSQYYSMHPELPLANAVAMINLDMVGRVRDGKLYVGGAGTGSTLRQTLDEVIPHYPQLKVDYSDSSGYGASDHMSFNARQVPVLFFFSGLHSDYHKPSDTWDKIDAPSAVQVLRLIAEVATRLDTAETKPAFLRVEPNPHSGNTSGISSSGGGYGPDFGSVPDFAEPPKGVRFADIRAGSPAAKAGLKPGDILIKFDTRDIANLYDFTYALREHKPGDTVEVEVLRNGQSLKVSVLLTQRR